MTILTLFIECGHRSFYRNINPDAVIKCCMIMNILFFVVLAVLYNFLIFGNRDVGGASVLTPFAWTIKRVSSLGHEGPFSFTD